MNQQESANQTLIEDLPLDEAWQEEMKGGPTGTSGPGNTGQSIVL